MCSIFIHITLASKHALCHRVTYVFSSLLALRTWYVCIIICPLYYVILSTNMSYKHRHTYFAEEDQFDLKVEDNAPP